MLLANKGERGKKKLADKWEPVVYTVVDKNPQTHIYKISDATGQCKVVHRNLPVPNTLESQSLGEQLGQWVLSDADVFMGSV